MTRSLYRYHPTLGYTFIPGLQTRELHEGGGYLIRTNAAGFRSAHDFSAAKRPGAFRVLLFGDSYTAGMGVSDRDRYGEQVERLLPGVEVFNFGLPGSGTDQQYLAYRECAGGIEHDLVVIAVMVENIRRVAARYRPAYTSDGRLEILAKPYYTLGEDGASLTLHHVPVPKAPVQDSPALEGVDRSGRLVWLRKTVNKLGPAVKDYAQKVTRYQPLPEYNSPEHPDWRLLASVVSRWVGELRAPVLLMPIPMYYYVENTASAAPYQSRFRELAERTGALLHDPLPDFQRHSSRDRRGFRFRVDCHLTPPAHRVLGASLAPVIERVRGAS